MKKGRRVFTMIIAGIIAGILATIAVPLYLHYTETSRLREGLGMMKAIVTSQKVEKLRTGKYYSASTIAEFQAKGVDISKAKSSIFETFPTPDGGFTVRVTPKNTSSAAGCSMTYTHPPLPTYRLPKPYDLLLTRS